MTKCRIRRFANMQDADSLIVSKALVDIKIEDLLSREEVHLNHKQVASFIKGRTVMVTGAAGSIGSEICTQVLSFGCMRLIAFDINENGLFYLENVLLNKYSPDKFKICIGSVRDKKRLIQVFSEFKPDVVFHAAAHKHVPMMEKNPCEAVKNNIFGTLNVIDTAMQYDVMRMVLISTDKAVNPTNIMGATKRIAELLVQKYDKQSRTEISAVRFGNVLGSNGSVIPTFKSQIEAGGPVTVTHKDIKRYFMTIPEAVELVLQAGAFANGGEIFVLDMGEPVKIYDLACDMIRLSGLLPHKEIEIKFTGLRPGEKMFEELSLKDEEVSKTTNDKIYVMKHDNDSPSDISQILLQNIEISASEGNIERVFDLIKKLVPTYSNDTEKQLKVEKATMLISGIPIRLKEARQG